MFAWLDSASIDCARLIRGTASIAKLVTPAAASARTPSPFVSGCRNPISTPSPFSRAVSSAVGGATLTTTSQRVHRADVVDQRRAGLLVLLVGDQRAGAGAALHDDLDGPWQTSLRTTSGTSATRRSPSAVSLGHRSASAGGGYRFRTLASDRGASASAVINPASAA